MSAERLWWGLSQTSQKAETTQHSAAFSSFVNLLKSEEAREQINLIVDCALAGKAKPVRSHSITSNPAIVQRAVLKDWNPPIFGMFVFTLKWSFSVLC